MKRRITQFVIALMVMWAGALWGAEGSADKGDLEKRVIELEKALQELKERESKSKGENDLASKIPLDTKKRLIDPYSWLNKFSLSGYVDMHANFREGKGGDKFDLHRIVFELGYEFSDWIKLEAEFEIEHAFVSDSSGGELVVEQFFVDFHISDQFGLRIGRVLAPLGWINQNHEPPSFHGVERPFFAQVIIPSTWSLDGVGIFGRLQPWWNYQLYVTGSLDGTGFNSTSGIRGGRIKERPSLNEPAVSGRFDFVPSIPGGSILRFGLSSYFGGLDNGNNGSNNSINGTIQIYSADFTYAFWRLQFRGALALEIIKNADRLGTGIAGQIFGWYLEGAIRVMPDGWKQGRLKKSEIFLFVRYENLDTQDRVPSGTAVNRAGQREVITVGVDFQIQANLVFKIDVQYIETQVTGTSPILFNLGLVWHF